MSETFKGFMYSFTDNYTNQTTMSIATAIGVIVLIFAIVYIFTGINKIEKAIKAKNWQEAQTYLMIALVWVLVFFRR